MENFLGSANTIVSQGAIYGAAGDGKVAFVDSRDTAAVAVKVLTEGGHEGKEYTLTGPEALTFAEAARRISTGIGKDVTYVDMPDEDFKGALTEAGLSEMVAEIFAQINRNAREGNLSKTSDTVSDLTGRPTRTLEAFARDHADTFIGTTVSD